MGSNAFTALVKGHPPPFEVSNHQLTAEMRLKRSPELPDDSSVCDSISAAGSKRHMQDIKSMLDPRCVWILLKVCALCLIPPTRKAVPERRKEGGSKTTDALQT